MEATEKREKIQANAKRPPAQILLNCTGALQLSWDLLSVPEASLSGRVAKNPCRGRLGGAANIRDKDRSSFGKDQGGWRLEESASGWQAKAQRSESQIPGLVWGGSQAGRARRGGRPQTTPPVGQGRNLGSSRRGLARVNSRGGKCRLDI